MRSLGLQQLRARFQASPIQIALQSSLLLRADQRCHLNAVCHRVPSQFQVHRKPERRFLKTPVNGCQLTVRSG